MHEIAKGDTGSHLSFEAHEDRLWHIEWHHTGCRRECH